MNPFYEVRIYIENNISALINFVGDNNLLIETCAITFFVGLVIGYLLSWYKYFWKHFMYRA